MEDENHQQLRRIVTLLRRIIDAPRSLTIQGRMSGFITMMNEVMWLMENLILEMNRESDGLFEELMDQIIDVSQTLSAFDDMFCRNTADEREM